MQEARETEREREREKERERKRQKGNIVRERKRDWEISKSRWGFTGCPLPFSTTTMSFHVFSANPSRLPVSYFSLFCLCYCVPTVRNRERELGPTPNDVDERWFVEEKNSSSLSFNKKIARFFFFTLFTLSLCSHQMEKMCWVKLLRMKTVKNWLSKMSSLFKPTKTFSSWPERWHVLYVWSNEWSSPFLWGGVSKGGRKGVREGVVPFYLCSIDAEFRSYELCNLRFDNRIENYFNT